MAWLMNNTLAGFPNCMHNYFVNVSLCHPNPILTDAAVMPVDWVDWWFSINKQISSNGHIILAVISKVSVIDPDFIFAKLQQAIEIYRPYRLAFSTESVSCLYAVQVNFDYIIAYRHV